MNGITNILLRLQYVYGLVVRIQTHHATMTLASESFSQFCHPCIFRQCQNLLRRQRPIVHRKTSHSSDPRVSHATAFSRSLTPHREVRSVLGGCRVATRSPVRAVRPRAHARRVLPRLVTGTVWRMNSVWRPVVEGTVHECADGFAVERHGQHLPAARDDVGGPEGIGDAPATRGLHGAAGPGDLTLQKRGID